MSDRSVPPSPCRSPLAFFSQPLGEARDGTRDAYGMLPGGKAALRPIGIAAAVPLLAVMVLNLSLDEAFKLVAGFLF